VPFVDNLGYMAYRLVLCGDSTRQNNYSIKYEEKALALSSFVLMLAEATAPVIS